MDDLRYRSGFHHTNDFNKNLAVPETITPSSSKGKSFKKTSKNKQENENSENLFKSKSFVWTNNNSHVENQKKSTSPFANTTKIINSSNNSSTFENLKPKYLQSNITIQQQQMQKESSLPLNLTSEFITPNPLLPKKQQPQQSQPLLNKINILNPIVLPNVSIELESEQKPEPQNKGIFVKELNADNYAVLSAQWHQNKNNVNKNDKINNFQQQMQERYAKSKSKDPSLDNCKYTRF